MSHYTWIDIARDLYSHGSVVVVDTDLVPTFGVIEDFVDESHCYFLAIQLLDAIYFTPHFYSFEVNKKTPKVYHICKPSALYDHLVLGKYQLQSHESFFIPLS